MDPVTFFLVASTATAVAGQVSASQAARAGGKAAMQTAEYNQSIRERNAKVAENEAALRGRVGEGQVDDFRRKYAALQSKAGTRYRASGVVASGTPLEVLFADDEATEEEKMIRLNTATDVTSLRERGANQRLAGQLTLMQGQQQQIASKIESRSELFSALSTAAFGAYRYGQIA